MSPSLPESLRVGLAQIAPVWLDREATLARVVSAVHEAADRGCALVAFGEAFVPGYPFWVALTDGAQFASRRQETMYAHYLREAVQPEAGHLAPVCKAAAARGIMVYLGTIERAADRGGHSLYCSLIAIDARGVIVSVHRKLMPTYEERLVWAAGDGHGLRVHRCGAFTVGGLNCWENWLPLARTALTAQGEDLHIAVWPGGVHNTDEITRFIARESRSYVVSVSGLLRADQIPEATPHLGDLLGSAPPVLANGGSCVAGPDGAWVLPPVLNDDGVLVAELDFDAVRRTRHNFDPAGHYARADVLQLRLDDRRQGVLTRVSDEPHAPGPTS